MKIVLISPSEEPIAIDLPFPESGNFPILILYPLTFASFSVNPILATWGLENVHAGIIILCFMDNFGLQICSTHLIPSWLALCANQGDPVTSPIAYIPCSEVTP